MVRRGLLAAGALAGALLPAAPAMPSQAVQLITASEAALPPGQTRGHDRSITRAPTVTILSPAPSAGMIKSPVALKIRDETHGGAKIDLDSVLLTYVKQPAISLTQRVKPFIAASGIDVEDAEVPPGTHTIRVIVTDTDGRTNELDFTFSVGQ